MVDSHLAIAIRSLTKMDEAEAPVVEEDNIGEQEDIGREEAPVEEAVVPIDELLEGSDDEQEENAPEADVDVDQILLDLQVGTGLKIKNLLIATSFVSLKLNESIPMSRLG